MSEYFITNFKEMMKLARRINDEDPSLVGDYNNLKSLKTDSLKQDVSTNGLMSKQAKQFERVQKRYDRSELQALSLASTLADISPEETEEEKDSNVLTADFDLRKSDGTPNAFTGKVIAEGDRNKLHTAIHGEITKEIPSLSSDKTSVSAGLFGSKSSTRTTHPDGVIEDQFGREVGAVIKGNVVLNDKAVIYGAASKSATKNKAEFLTFESENYGTLSVLEMGAVFGGLDANVKKFIDNSDKYTEGKVSYRWDGKELSASADTQGRFGINYEMKF